MKTQTDQDDRAVEHHESCGRYRWEQLSPTSFRREMCTDTLKIVLRAERIETQPERLRTEVTSTLGGHASLESATAKQSKSHHRVRVLLNELHRQLP